LLDDTLLVALTGVDRSELQGDEESQGARRPKLPFLDLIHNLALSQISVHTADVKSVLRVFSIEVPAKEKDDLKEEPIVIRLRKVRGCLVV
jgi:hypothetical protein